MGFHPNRIGPGTTLMLPSIILKPVSGAGGHLAVFNETSNRIISEAIDLRSDREVRRFVEDWAAEQGLIMNAIVTKEGQVSRFELHRPVTMTLTLSPQAADMIDLLSSELGMTRDAVIAQSIMLMKVASDAIMSGKSFGVASSPDSLEVEVVGLSTKRR